MIHWTKVQVELATLTFPKIGSISSLSPTGEAIIGNIASASGEGFEDTGTFNNSADYFAAAGQAAVRRFKSIVNEDKSFAEIGALAFCNIVSKTAIFQDMGLEGSFPLNHMDFGTQNIIVDDDFNFLATIDWEFAQAAPWHVNHYPMLFPPLGSQERTESILADPSHLACHATRVGAENVQSRFSERGGEAVRARPAASRVVCRHFRRQSVAHPCMLHKARPNA